MGLKLEEVNCGLCGSNHAHLFLKRGDLQLFLPGAFCLVRCDNCGLVYLNPRPTSDSMDDIYPPEYDQYTCDFDQDLNNPLKALRYYGLRKRVRAILKFKQSGKLLDIGCSTGDFLFVARAMTDWIVQGVEPNQLASQYAREKLGLDVYAGNLEEAPFPEGTFDIITLWNVLEHLPDPLGSLKKIQRLLKADGLLVLNTPNLDSMDAKLFGPFWIGYELPRHFYVFSRKTLFTLLSMAGFKSVKTSCIYGGHAWFMSSLRFWIRSRANPPRAFPRLESVLFSLPMRLLMAPFMFALDQYRLTTAPIDFCIKEDIS